MAEKIEHEYEWIQQRVQKHLPSSEALVQKFKLIFDYGEVQYMLNILKNEDLSVEMMREVIKNFQALSKIDTTRAAYCALDQIILLSDFDIDAMIKIFEDIQKDYQEILRSRTDSSQDYIDYM